MAFNWPSKKQKTAASDATSKGQITGFTKPKRFLFFKVRSKPIYGPAPGQQVQGAQGTAQPKPVVQLKPTVQPKPVAQPGPFVQQKQPQAAQPAQAPQPGPVARAGQAVQRKPWFAPRPKPMAQPRPIVQPSPAVQSSPAVQQQRRGVMRFFSLKPKVARPEQAGPQVRGPGARPTQLQIYLVSTAARHKDLEAALRAQNIKESPYEFVRKMFVYAVAITVVVTIGVGTVMLEFGVPPAASLLLALVLGLACYMAFFNKFIRYPLDRSVVLGNEIEKDILFAARDMVISMRSGMPLFNAITAVSTGYGAASLEFAKVVELVQLGTPIEQAIDQVSERSKSKTFKRLALQTTVSLKAGADIVGSLQGVVDDVMQERIIELRRYGQRLNALAMFYMLFGVIFPSMGIAVLAILTTFVNIFTVDENTLIFALVGIFFLQVVFLNVMRSSRPTFAM